MQHAHENPDLYPPPAGLCIRPSFDQWQANENALFLEDVANFLDRDLTDAEKTAALRMRADEGTILPETVAEKLSV